MSNMKYSVSKQYISYLVNTLHEGDCARYILHLTYSVCRRNVLVNRVWLTPFSAPLESKPDLLKSTATNRGAGKNVRTTSHYETQSQCGYGAYSDCQERDHPNPAAAEGLP